MYIYTWGSFFALVLFKAVVITWKYSLKCAILCVETQKEENSMTGIMNYDHSALTFIDYGIRKSTKRD